MDSRKTIFLDTSILHEIAQYPTWAGCVFNFIEQNDYVLVVEVMHLIEIYKWRKYWGGVASFISSVPFVISENPENITKVEVTYYPQGISLPIAYNPAQSSLSKSELKQVIEILLKGKVSHLEQNYRNEYKNIWQSFLDNRKTFLPDNGKNYSDSELKTFFQWNVSNWLYATGHKAFLEKLVSTSQGIVVECFKSIYLPLLAIFVEYHNNKKNGKPSDVGDFYHLGIIPYVEFAILDNERHELIERINRESLFPQRLHSCNLKQFKQMVIRK